MKYNVGEVSRAIESRMHRWGLQFHGQVRVLIEQLRDEPHVSSHFLVPLDDRERPVVTGVHLIVDDDEYFVSI